MDTKLIPGIIFALVICFFIGKWTAPFKTITENKTITEMAEECKDRNGILHGYFDGGMGYLKCILPTEDLFNYSL